MKHEQIKPSKLEKFVAVTMLSGMLVGVIAGTKAHFVKSVNEAKAYRQIENVSYNVSSLIFSSCAISKYMVNQFRRPKE